MNIFSISPQIQTIVFIILAAISRAKFHLSRMTFTEISLFDDVIYSSSGVHCRQFEK